MKFFSQFVPKETLLHTSLNMKMLRLLTAMLLLVRTYAFAPVNNRIFVGGNFGTIDSLARMFRAYGKIEEIRLMDDVAFVTFVDAASAEAALQHQFSEVDVKISHTTPLHSVERQCRTVEEWEDIMRLVHAGNFAVQVQKINLHGLRHFCSNHMDGVEVIGSLDVASNDAAMFYMKVDDYNAAIDILHDAHALRYHKIYPSIDGIVRGTILDVARRLWVELEKLPKQLSIRLQVFPPSLRDAVQAAIEEFRPSPDIRISSSSYSHVYSVVGITAYGSDERGGVFMVGLAEPNSPLSKASQS